MDLKDLLVHSSLVLPAFQMPAKVNFVETLPRNASGKLQRQKEGHE
jgi:acyl-coenzyme A synthetase/AMP-(fatty) acid ligase